MHLILFTAFLILITLFNCFGKGIIKCKSYFEKGKILAKKVTRYGKILFIQLIFAILDNSKFLKMLDINS